MRGSVGSRWGARFAAAAVAFVLIVAGMAPPAAATAVDDQTTVTVSSDRWWKGQFVPLEIAVTHDGAPGTGYVAIYVDGAYKWPVRSLDSEGFHKSSIATASLEPGDHVIEVEHLGELTWDEETGHLRVLSSGTTTIRVEEPTPPVITPDTWYYGDPHQLTVDLTGTGMPQNGTVTIQAIGPSRSATLAGGVATFALDGTEVRPGDSLRMKHVTTETGELLGSWMFDLDVRRRPTSFTVDMPSTWRHGNPVVQIPVQVTSELGIPHGTVRAQFLKDIGGEPSLTGLDSAVLVEGRATLRVDPAEVPVGTRSVQISYSGGYEFESQSRWVDVEILPRHATKVTVRTDEVWTYGTPRSVAVSVSSASGTPAGTVQLWQDGRWLASGTLMDGKASIKVKGSKVEPGQQDILAKYTGSSRHQPSTRTWTQRVRKAQPKVRLILPTTAYPVGADLGSTEPATIRVHTRGLAEKGRLVLWTRDPRAENPTWRSRGSVASWTIWPWRQGVRHVQIPSRLLRTADGRPGTVYLKVRYTPDWSHLVARSTSDPVRVHRY